MPVSQDTVQRVGAPWQDDLTRIAGIGPEIVRRLNEAGIRTYADFADCSAGEIAKVLPELLWGCIGRWRDRAQELAGGTAMPPERGGPAAGNGQHYESFIVRVLLNDDGSIRDTRMEHIGTGEVKRWAGWEHDAMLGFIREAAAPPVLLAAPVGPLDAEPQPESVPEPAAEPSATAQVRPISQAPVTSQPPVTPRAPTTPSPSAHPEAPQAAVGSAAADASPPGLLAPIVRLRPDRTLLRGAQPFTVTLSLDLTGVTPQNEGLIYNAVVAARQLGGRSGRTLARPRGLLKAAGTTAITIDAGGLPPGIYLLEAAVTLRAAGASRGGVAAMAEGIMLQVLPS